MHLQLCYVLTARSNSQAGLSKLTQSAGRLLKYMASMSIVEETDPDQFRATKATHNLAGSNVRAGIVFGSV